MQSMEYIRSEGNNQWIYVQELWRNKRSLVYQGLNLAMVVFSALMIWKGCMVLTNSESPIVVVLSGSMEPGIYRGDILFLDNSYETPIRVGEIVVFQIKHREIPIVHRVLQVRESTSGGLKYLTKGDNNQVDDRGLYAPRQMWLSRQEILGRAKAILPHVGYVTILLNDYPYLKYVLVGGMGFFVLTTKE